MKICTATLLLLLSFSVFSQEATKAIRSNYFKLRTNNVLELGGGVATPNVDFPEPEFDFSGTIGYKAVIFPHFRIGLSYHKFNLTAVKFEEGFMSFDLNTEFVLFPYSKFTPYIFAGSGYNASDDFDNTSLKAQGGGGLEYMIMRHLGIKAYAAYNYLFDDELDNFEFGESNDSYLRFGMGINFYFGRTKKRHNLKGKKTIFNQNEIEQ